jgi:drug/metabolite transporter (DMT)-like permease
VGRVSAVLALLASLVWGTSDFVGGLTARRLPVRALVLTSQGIGLVLLVVTTTALRLWRLDAGSLAWGLSGGAVGIVALGAFYRALARGPMSIVSPVASIGVLVPFIGGLARGERPAGLQLAGAVLAIAGVALAARPAHADAGTGRNTEAVVLAILAAVGFGFVLLAVQEGSRSSIVMTLVWMRVCGVGVLAITALVTLRTRLAVPRWPGRGDLRAVAVVGSFDLLANALYALAGRGHLLSVVAVLSSLYPAVTALLAWRIVRERLGRAQTVGVLGALGGVILLAAG